MSETRTFSVPDMSCEHCRRRITETLEQTAGVTAVAVDLAAKRVTVTAEAETGILITAIENSGYHAELIS